MDILSLSSVKCQISSPISATGVFPDQSPACSRHSIKVSVWKWHSEVKRELQEKEPSSTKERVQNPCPSWVSSKARFTGKAKLLTWWSYELPSNTEVYALQGSVPSCLFALRRPDNQWASEMLLIDALHNTLIEHFSWKCPWQSITQPNWENGLNVSLSLYLKIAYREWKYCIRNATCSLPNQVVQGKSMGCVKMISSHGLLC